MKVLATLLDFIFPPRTDECIVRSLTPDAVAALIAPELVETTRPSTTALISFDDERVRALVREAKYHDSRKAQKLLGGVLAEYLVEIATDTYGTVVLVPLPLSATRRRERGFNQCERIASYALAGSEVRMDTEALLRTKDTEHQARLGRKERLKNVTGAFSARGALDSSLTYLLFDDVVTTGATMQAAIAALRAGGARHILPIALARSG